MENHTHDKNTEPEIPETSPGLRARLLKPVTMVATTVIAASIICVSIALLLYSNAETDAAGKKPQPPEKIIAENSTAQMNQTMLYEEPMEDDLDDLVKRIDLALITTLKEAEISMSELKLEDVSLKKHQGRDFHFQQLSFPCKGEKKEFVSRIEKGVQATALNASVHEVSPEKWLISINGVPTHRFSLFNPIPDKKSSAAVPDPNAPRIAIVIDDMGEDVRLAKGLAGLDIHITFSIWPNSSHVKKTIAIARENGNEIMIHLPMQPKGYPKVNPGADALLMGMTAEQIQKIVQAAESKVPGARGLNNHMGSRFTEDYYGMKQVMGELKKKKLFFLDSRTTPKSSGTRAAKNVGVTAYERNIFLDNVKNISAIKYQLSKTAEIAKKVGQAIAIGHPNHETLKAIRQWAKENKGKVRVVPVEQLRPVS